MWLQFGGTCVMSGLLVINSTVVMVWGFEISLVIQDPILLRNFSVKFYSMLELTYHRAQEGHVTSQNWHWLVVCHKPNSAPSINTSLYFSHLSNPVLGLIPGVSGAEAGCRQEHNGCQIFWWISSAIRLRAKVTKSSNIAIKIVAKISRTWWTSL